MKVYVSGPITGRSPMEEISNVFKAMDAGLQLIREGLTVYVPHLTWFLHKYGEHNGINIPYDQWIKMDLDLLQSFDVLLFLGPSKGELIERSFAEEHGIKIYNNINDLIGYARNVRKKEEVAC